MTNYKELADLLMPDVNAVPEDIMGMYPPRRLCEGAVVARFAPSPTGMLHIGGLYAALVSERLAHQSGGVFYLRIEDTDKKREVKHSIPDIIDSMAYFGIRFDEGMTGVDAETGSYGPYRQSARASIYKVFVKCLVEKGLAYPCFCTEVELESLRKAQEEAGVRPGYYGKWALHRHFSLDQIGRETAVGRKYVIRLKSPGSVKKKLVLNDLIKGDVIMPENDQDIVILKSDGLPTYHFAHVIDDFLMGTTHVIRGDEWLPSVPLHLQLFELLGFKKPYYGHISPILKKEGNSKRKFSKRKDLDATAGYYRELGYPGQAVTEYFLNLINSDYEKWKAENPSEPYSRFVINPAKMSVSGALFDINKLDDISKNVIASYSAGQVYNDTLRWAGTYDRELFELMKRYPEYTLNILDIERVSDKPGKNFAKWADIKPNIGYFYDELFNKLTEGSWNFPAATGLEDIGHIISSYMDIYNPSDEKPVWFEKIRCLSEKIGYARDIKAFKRNPEAYKGHVGDVTAVLRIALTGRAATPDLYEIMRAMGRERLLDRLSRYLKAMDRKVFV